MKVVIISDTHSLHRRLTLPEGDVLIHCGDFSGMGSEWDVIQLNKWLGEQKFAHKLVTPGNHDRLAEDDLRYAKNLMTNARLLVDQAVTIKGKKFYLSPWSPEFCNWAYMKERGEPMKKVWAKIPEGLDVLVTHSPPMGILDGVPEFNRKLGEWEVRHVGCADLYNRVLEVKPKVHAFGHIHEGYGQVEKHGIKFINASTCDKDYHPSNPPIVIEI